MSGRDAALDADSGILINEGKVFASSTLGMVETPSKNSSQYILSFAQSKEIASNTNISILDQNDKLLFTINLLKPAQSLIISILKFSLNETYRIYGGESELASFNVNGIITQVGSSTSSRLGGGMSPHH